MSIVWGPDQIDYVKNKLAAKGLNQSDLAVATECSTTAVSNWFNGSIPRISTLQKIAQFLEVNIEEIIDTKPKTVNELLFELKEKLALKMNVSIGSIKLTLTIES